jgi:NitT/TauT family transport system substrate-binding protein
MRHSPGLLALSTAALIMIASCGGAQPRQATTTTLRLALPTDVTSFANADVPVAQAQGFFRDAHLRVTVTHLSSGVPVIQGIVGGSLDVGASSIEPVVNAHAQGGGLVIIGSYADRLTVSMVTPTSVRTPADLRGKRLGIQQVGAFREVMTRMVLSGAGLTPGDVSYIPVDANSYTSALARGTIASAILQREQAIDVLQRAANLHVLVDLDQVRPDYFYGAYAVTKSWLAGHQDVATRFLTAITRAHRWMYQNRAGTIPIVAEATGFSEQVVGQAYDVLLGQQGVFGVNTGLDATRIAGTIDTMRQFKILTGTAPDESSLVDTGPISAVVRQLGEWKGDPRWH